MEIELMGRVFRMVYLLAHPGIHEALKTGQIEGVAFKVLDRRIEVGDTYIAERNVGLKLLTAKEIIDGFVVPEEMAYCYDTGECIPVELEL